RAVAQLREKRFAVLRRQPRRGDVLRIERGRGGVVERAQQPGDIAQWARFRAALGERLSRLAFEIDDENVATRDQHLAEMKVAMDAGLGRAEALLRECPQRFHQRLML